MATALGVVVITVIAIGLWLPNTGAEADDVRGTEIRSCTVIDEPGRYVLVADLADSGADTCLRIQSSDVVLDGAGHTVDGVGAFGTTGVLARGTGGESLTNVTVRHLTVTDWDDSVRYIGVDEGRIGGLTVADSRVGIDLLNSRHVTVADSVARGNRLRGIAVMESGVNHTIRNATVTANAVFGVHLVGPGVRDNTPVGNTVSKNEFGIVLIGARDNRLADNVAADNAIAGIWLATATGNTVAGNTVSGQFYGIFLSDGAVGNTVTNTDAESNDVGIRLRTAHENDVTDNTVRSSRDTAILLIGSDDNRVVGNDGTANARGIVVIRSDGNELAENAVS